MNNELEMVLKELNKLNKELDKSIDKAMSKDRIKVARLFSILQNHIGEFEHFARKELSE